MAKSLLVIDDSSTIHEATQLALTGGEWDLVAAASGAEAMEALQQNRVDAILCDIAPGDEDGYELCRTLGASAEGSGIPTLLMGGNVNATAALAVGASATLPKPFTSELLQQTLQETMEQSDFSFDFDDVPATAVDHAPLEVEPMVEEFGLQPAEGIVESTEVEETEDIEDIEEIEVIDLSDEAEFEDLELLDDLEPVELPPIEPAPGVASEGALDLGATTTGELPSAEPADLDLEDMLAGDEPVPATEEPDSVPMELSPAATEDPVVEGQEPEAGLTIDGLVLGGDESPQADLTEEPVTPAAPEREAAFAFGEPDLSGDVEPTLPDPYPSLSEDALGEAGQTPYVNAGVEPIGVEEMTSLEEEAIAALGFDSEADQVDSPAQETEEPDVLDVVPVPPPADEEPGLATPIVAETFSDLEREWAREEPPAPEEISFPEEDGVTAETSLEALQSELAASDSEEAEQISIPEEDGLATETALEELQSELATSDFDETEQMSSPAEDGVPTETALEELQSELAASGFDETEQVPSPEEDGVATETALEALQPELAASEFSETEQIVPLVAPEDSEPVEAAGTVEPIEAATEPIIEDAPDAGAWDLPFEADATPSEDFPTPEPPEEEETPVEPVPIPLAAEATPVPPMSSMESLNEDLDTLTGEVPEPEAHTELATTVAAAAGQAVRDALQDSLSAERLTPLVEAAVERVAWEVVPQLAERLIREAIAKLQEDPPTQ